MSDGIPVSNRVDNLTERKNAARVVDNVLNSASYAGRIIGMGEAFEGKTDDHTIKVVNSNQGQFYSGLENLNTAASDTTITLSYSHTAFTQPVVIPMLEAFANAGSTGTIDLGDFKRNEAEDETIERLGTAIFSTGSGDQPNGLEKIVDDGTNVGTIGGQSRSTYPALNATVTSSGGTLSLLKLANLYASVAPAGVAKGAPTVNVSDQTVFNLYESLLNPTIRAEYQSIGFDKLPVRGKAIVKPGSLRGQAGFDALSYRGRPLIADDKAPSGIWYMLNERYLIWKGRHIVPKKFEGKIVPVSLGKAGVIDGVRVDMPSKYHGFFFQKEQMLLNQAGMVGRFHVIGQLVTNQPRRQGKLTDIAGV